MPCLHKKLLSGWQMELFLGKIAYIVLGVKYAKSRKIHSVNNISRKEYLKILYKASFNHITMVYSS